MSTTPFSLIGRDPQAVRSASKGTKKVPLGEILEYFGVADISQLPKYPTILPLNLQEPNCAFCGDPLPVTAWRRITEEGQLCEVVCKRR